MAADLALQFSSGLSAGLSPGSAAALLGSSPVHPGPLAAAPQSLGEDADVATKKRKMREAEQQPLLQPSESPLTQVSAIQHVYTLQDGLNFSCDQLQQLPCCL